MTLRVVESNRSEELAAWLAGFLADAADPFAPPYLVTENRVVERWLQYEVARRTGIASGYAARRMQELLGEVLTADRKTLRALDPSRLEAVCASVLADAALLAEPALAEPRAYLDEDGDDGRGPRRVQLAAQLADRFWEYALTRPDWLDAWERGAAADVGDGDEALAAWQARLWRAVTTTLDRLAARGPRWVPTPRLAVVRRKAGVPAPPGPAVVVAGFGFLPRAYLDALAYLGEAREVIVLALSPCAEYWGDVARTPRRPPRTARPVQARGPDDPPALARWGSPGRDYLSALAELSEGDIDDRFVDPAPEQPSARERWAFDTLVRAVAEPGEPAASHGVTILACPSPVRELEIVASEIVRRCAADPTLAASDVAVLLPPSATEVYLAQLPAVFGALELPYHVVDVPAVGHGHVVEAAQLLLDLPLGTFRRPELLGLMTHPSVQARHPHVDPADWVKWADALGIVHGADHRDHQGTYLADADHFHWEQGLRRLALGAFMASTSSGAEVVARLAHRTYLPEEVAADDQASAATFALLARSLIADARWLRGLRRTLTGWAAVLDGLCDAYLGGRGPSGAAELTRVRAVLSGLADLDVDGRELDYREAAELARRRLDRVRGDRGEPLAHGVHVARLTPHRPLPFRVVFAVGLGEDQFPASDRPAMLDVRRDRRRHDVGARDRDRYGFLETALAVRDELVLSYVAREPVSGEARMPSTVVHELAEMLAPYLAVAPDAALEQLTVEHPLHRFAPAYDAELPASAAATTARERHAARVRATVEDAAARAGASVPGARDLLRTLSSDDALAGVAATFGVGLGRDLRPPGDDAPLVIRLTALRRFLDSAPQGWASAVLRLEQDDDDDGAVDRDEEPLALDALERSVVVRTAFGRYLAGEPLDDAIEHTWRRRALAGSVPVGVFAEATRARLDDTVRGWAAELDHHGGPRQAFTVFGLGKQPREQAEVLPPIRLEVDTPGGRRAVEIVGTTHPWGEHAGCLVLAPGSLHARHWLRAAFDHLVLAAAGRMRFGMKHLLLGGKSRTKAKPVEVGRHTPWDPDEARAHLALLVGDLLATGHEYLFSLDMAVSALKGKPIRVDEPRDHLPGAIGYGPLPPRADLAAPTEDDIIALAERRLGPMWKRCPMGGR